MSNLNNESQISYPVDYEEQSSKELAIINFGFCELIKKSSILKYFNLKFYSWQR